MPYKLTYDRESCIGAGECEAIAKHLWEVDNEGRATLKGATLNEATGLYELEIPDSEAKDQELVVGSCPIGCIKLEKM